MAEKYFWLPEWASDLSLWEDELVNVAPAATHVFVSYDKMSEHLDDIYALKGLAEANTVVGWGMGAFVLLLNAAKKPQGQKWILLAPYADFCDLEGSWTSKDLMDIVRDMGVAPEAGLKPFAEQFEDEFGDWQEDWMAAAKKMNVKSLIAGVEYLSKHKLEKPLENSSDIQVVYGKMDQATLPSQVMRLKPFLPQATFKERPKAGHWPPMLLF